MRTETNIPGASENVAAAQGDQNQPQKKQGRLRASFRALRHRNYRLFFAGQLVSLTGSWIHSVAQSWLVYRLTGSATLLGLVGFASQVPTFLIVLIGGAVADRRNRHHILIATQVASMSLAFLLAALTLTNLIQVWHLFVFAVLLGLVNAFYIPTQSAFVVDMVGKEDLMNAIALNSSIVTGARIVGPAVGGVLVATIGEGWCFLLNGASYVAVITGLLLMRITPREKAAPPGSALANIIEGFRFVKNTGPVFALLILLGFIALIGTPYAVLMPIFADQVLQGGPRGLGLLMAAAGTGAMIGALILAIRHGSQGLGRWVGLATAGFGLSLTLFSLSRSFWLSFALLVIVGLTLMLQLAASNTLVQSIVPDELRGRVMSVYSMVFMGMAPIGALLAGSLGQRFGAPNTLGVCGLVCMAGALLFSLKFRNLHQAPAESSAAAPD